MRFRVEGEQHTLKSLMLLLKHSRADCFLVSTAEESRTNLECPQHDSRGKPFVVALHTVHGHPHKHDVTSPAQASVGVHASTAHGLHNL